MEIEQLLDSLRISTPPISPPALNDNTSDGNGSSQVSSSTADEDEPGSPVSSTDEVSRDRYALWSDTVSIYEGDGDTTTELGESPGTGSSGQDSQEDPPSYACSYYIPYGSDPVHGTSDHLLQPTVVNGEFSYPAYFTNDPFVPPPQLPPPYSPLPESADFSLQYFLAARFLGMQAQRLEYGMEFNPPPYPPPYAEIVPGMQYGFGGDGLFHSQHGQFPPIPAQVATSNPMPPPPFHPPLQGQNTSYVMPLMLQMPPFQEVVPPQYVPQRQQPPGAAPRPVPNFLGGTTFFPQRQVAPAPRTPIAQIRAPRPLNPYAQNFLPKTLFSWEMPYQHDFGNGISRGAAPSNRSLLGVAPMHYRLDPPAIHTPQLTVSTLPTDKNGPYPYVSSVWDPKVMGAMKPIPNFAYYVPPRVDDNDYFGGQIRVWQDKMIPTFQLFMPDIWTLQGLPLFNTEFEQEWYFFTITCKLRFCCRKCFRPWTSMRGKIHFAFKRDTMAHKGTVLMKIFGQVCNQDRCDDKDFQTPACYPEEIHRVLVKLSEYIGYVLYLVPLSAMFYTEPDKAVRGGNPRSPHRPALCQACQQGICSRRT